MPDQIFASCHPPLTVLKPSMVGACTRMGRSSGQSTLANKEICDEYYRQKANQTYAEEYDRKLGLPHVDIDVIRTGGPAVTEDVLGELIVSSLVLGRKIMLLNHTGCGFTTFTDD